MEDKKTKTNQTVNIEEIQKPKFTQYYDKEDAYKNLDRVISWVNNCDTKTSILTAFVAGILALFANGFSNIAYLFDIWCLEDINAWHIIKFIIIILLLIAFIVFLFIIIKNIFIVLTAKIDFKKYQKNYLTNSETNNISYEGSILFFETIAKHSKLSFIEQEKKIGEEEFFDDISTQIYFNAKRCTEKFICYNKALKFSILLLINALLLFCLTFT